jgi:hypothetical protein
MATPRLYVARDERVLVVSRKRLRTVGGRTSARRWPGVVESSSATPDPEPPRSLIGAAVVGVPPVVTFALLRLLDVDVAIAALVALMLFFGSAYVAPVVRKRITRRRALRASGDGTPAMVAGSENSRLLFDAEERATFERALATADRISDTWPELGGLVDTTDAEPMLGRALWDLSGLLARRQQVRRVLAGLDRPEYADLPAGDAARDLEEHRANASQLLAGLDADIARREASLVAAEQAGRDFVREREARDVARNAARALRELTPDPHVPVVPDEDPAGELAERTETVLAAYRELTSD